MLQVVYGSSMQAAYISHPSSCNRLFTYPFIRRSPSSIDVGFLTLNTAFSPSGAIFLTNVSASLSVTVANTLLLKNSIIAKLKNVKIIS